MPSEKFTGIRIKPETLEKLRALAAADSRSMTNYLELLINKEYQKLP